MMRRAIRLRATAVAAGVRSAQGLGAPAFLDAAPAAAASASSHPIAALQSRCDALLSCAARRPFSTASASNSGPERSVDDAAHPSGLTHVDASGKRPAMVDVGGKSVTRREATAQSLVLLPDAVAALFDEGKQDWQGPKGPVLVTAIIAGTSAVKATSTLIPFCHPLPVEKCKFALERVAHAHALGAWAIRVHCSVACTARTGVEMEALTGASVAALTVYDMLKAVSHDIVIDRTRLLAKSGGKADYAAPDAPAAAPAAAVAAAARSSAPAPARASSAKPRPPCPPFTRESALAKTRAAEDAWNRQDPVSVAAAYSPDSVWRNRAEFLQGTDAIVEFLRRKWSREHEYRLVKELWCHEEGGSRIAVRFVYEWLDKTGTGAPGAPPEGQWMRAHGNENWQFDAAGYMTHRHASINDVGPIAEHQRKFRWTCGQPRPLDHPGLTEMGL